MQPTPQPPKTILLLIDIQNGFLPAYHPPSFWGPSRSNPSFSQNITTLLSHYRALVSHAPTHHKIIHIKHASTTLTSPLHPLNPEGGYAFQEFAKPLEGGGEEVVVKGVNSAFVGTGLEGVVRGWFGKVDEDGGDGNGNGNGNVGGRLYVVGLSTDHCVSTTVRMAGNLGVCDVTDGKGEVVLIGDATAAWGKGGWDAETVHAVHVESLREFASVKGTEEVVKELLDIGMRV